MRRERNEIFIVSNETIRRKQNMKRSDIETEINNLPK